MHAKIVYLRLQKRVKVKPGQVLRLADVCQIIVDESYQSIREIPIYQSKWSDGTLAVIDVIDVIQTIHRHEPSLDVRNLGGGQTIIEWPTSHWIPKGYLVCFVWVLLFVGSGLAIMNFHKDVSMEAVLERIYFLITGIHSTRPLLMQIPYSFGIGTGMILFFNHLFKRRFNDEPSPLEVEMFLYQENLDQYVIDNEKEREKTIRGPSS
ncbi:stage V sporulation protein AA [Mechercharimyces sp. CAU 1602]|uniref:stage V sporulation protein AA n=1 Tax=Mechercharimyces sp. CAU 1602 TaxID=2973933 RepID=UPI00216281D2|nr:stage V sporulation protein AA [Mechercharimyces sp. CAU 1602]MCS1350845.1 stage V sporulation protein AA [Mechercharimyces sp. CAU 1602]